MSVKMNSFLLFCFIHLSYTVAQFVHKFNVLVDTPYGKVEGFSVGSLYAETPNLRINHFLGIPFARRPTQFGDDYKTKFRFMKPVEPSWNGIWDATKYGPACPQHPWYVRQTLPGFNRFSEDCLYMNIFAPNVTDERPTGSNPPLYPVMVYIHGGGFTVGTSQMWPGTILAQRKIVVVTFNYRLNALGFLSTGEQNAPGNYGMWDQVRALEFVKDHISHFRGNPHKITLVGHSTGGASVGLHLISPRSANLQYPLFQQAILMSGSDLSEWAVVHPTWHAQEYARKLGDILACPTSDYSQLVRCMRLSRTSDEIVNASIRVSIKEGTVGNAWGPVVDGQTVGVSEAFLPDPPRKQREQGRFPHIRVMAGLAMDDGSWFIPNLPTLPDGVTETEFDNIIREFLQDRGVEDFQTTLEAVKFQYTYWPDPKNKTAKRESTVELMSDYMFGSAVNEVLNFHAQQNTTYFYVFNYKSYYDYLPYWRGVAHGQELQYLFGFPFFNETYVNITGVYPRQRYTYGDTSCSEFIMNMFTNFTVSGEPTSRHFDKKDFYNVTWMQYNLKNHSTLIINNMSTSRNVLNFRQLNYAFWLNYYPRLAGQLEDLRPKFAAPQESVMYEKATWALCASAGLLLIIMLAIVIAFYRTNKKQDDQFSSPAVNDYPFASRATDDDQFSRHSSNDDKFARHDRNDDYFSKYDRNDDEFSRQARNDEKFSRHARNDDQFSRPARNDEKFSRHARNDDYFSKYDRNDDEFSSHARKDDQFSRQARNDEKFSRHARNDDQFSNQARNDDRFSRQARNDDKFSRQARNDDQYSRQARNDDQYSRHARNGDKFSGRARSDHHSTEC